LSTVGEKARSDQMTAVRSGSGWLKPYNVEAVLEEHRCSCQRGAGHVLVHVRRPPLVPAGVSSGRSRLTRSSPPLSRSPCWSTARGSRAVGGTLTWAAPPPPPWQLSWATRLASTTARIPTTTPTTSSTTTSCSPQPPHGVPSPRPPPPPTWRRSARPPRRRTPAATGEASCRRVQLLLLNANLLVRRTVMYCKHVVVLYSAVIAEWGQHLGVGVMVCRVLAT